MEGPVTILGRKATVSILFEGGSVVHVASVLVGTFLLIIKQDGSVFRAQLFCGHRISSYEFDNIGSAILWLEVEAKRVAREMAELASQTKEK